MSDSLYLGRTVDPASGAISADRFEYRTDRFVRHGVCIGMTGSGKTGLSVSLVEELVLHGVPVICIDPKGDLANLALGFPRLRGSDFAPWVDDSEARREGITTDALGQKTADMWREGLAHWGMDGERIQRLQDAMDLTIYTPGSEAGASVNVMGALSRPDDATLADGDARRELVAGTVSGLLSLVGVDADPVRSPEHLVLSQIVDAAWGAGEDLDAEALILRVVDPPFKKVGVFPLDRFWSPDDRMDLAMKLNGVIASPTFQAWTQGERIDPVRLTDTSNGRVPVSVYYLAHLADSERMFFCALLLERILAWSRAQSGTSSLRALVFLDEAYGFMPPHPANPPTKKPLLTLMKQARAVGVGVLLSTQNPVDLDYKGLTNAGTWFLGRLSTQQDIKRVSEGLRTAGASGDDVSALIGRLKPRQFLLRDIKSDTPTLFNTRWAMSYLRGPITRHELARLPGGHGDVEAIEETIVMTTPPPPRTPEPPPIDDGLHPVAPASPRGSDRFFLDPRTAFSARMDGVFERFARGRRDDDAIEYQPALYARLSLRFDEEKAGFIKDEDHHRVWFPLDGGRLPESPLAVTLEADDLDVSEPEQGRFGELPEWLDESPEVTAARKEIVELVYRNEARGQWVCPPLRLAATHDESQEEFTARCQEAVEDLVDDDIGKLKERYDNKIDRLEERVRKKENQRETLETRAKAEKAQEMVNIGEVVLSFFVGRKRSVGSVLSKRKTAATTNRRIDSAEDDISALRAQLEEVAEELQDKAAAIEDEHAEALDAIEQRDVRLEKNDIHVRDFGILWIPVTRRI